MQNAISLSGPLQTLPPNAGAGLSQVRILILTASFPHVELQEDHSDHSVHPPCVVQLITYQNMNKNVIAMA